MDAGAHEFADTERFLAAGEALLGPYVWGKYDVLLMPPSFAYGGMENPVGVDCARVCLIGSLCWRSLRFEEMLVVFEDSA